MTSLEKRASNQEVQRQVKEGLVLLDSAILVDFQVVVLIPSHLRRDLVGPVDLHLQTPRKYSSKCSVDSEEWAEWEAAAWVVCSAMTTTWTARSLL